MADRTAKCFSATRGSVTSRGSVVIDWLFVLCNKRRFCLVRPQTELGPKLLVRCQVMAYLLLQAKGWEKTVPMVERSLIEHGAHSSFGFQFPLHSVCMGLLLYQHHSDNRPQHLTDVQHYTLLSTFKGYTNLCWRTCPFFTWHVKKRMKPAKWVRIFSPVWFWGVCAFSSFSCFLDWFLEKVQDQHNYMATSVTKSFARCIFWQLHQIKLFSHILWNPSHLLFLGEKDAIIYPLLINCCVTG